ncbi:hypothetical protein LWI28_009811 [Acer negundo]|uniref:EF-hand domain-containing protein n=1 Tax=Acer negundo TaxID=4023 RepID=A0AAD5ID70_ACENE|nr:hypothetical protein LWI28_009811 [Acer negundo]KAK4839983.1 hypothetical protein QYF36_026445 [Acer negundo]
MKLINKINKLSPKRIFGSKKDKYEVSRSDPSSFSSGSSASSTDSSSSANNNKPTSKTYKPATPTSVLPQASGDWSDISTDLLSDLSQALRLLDKDNDGIVSRTQLETLLRRLGAHPPTGEELSLMLSEVDRDGDGCIPVDVLMNQVAGSQEPAAETELRETFNVFDTDQDGKITAEELQSVFSDLGDERCTLDECRRMIEVVDKNGDGFVCFEDFLSMMELHR